MMGSSQAMKNAITSLTSGTDGTISQFNEPDLLDDLRDHWTSSDHLQEREMIVRKLQVGQDVHHVVTDAEYRVVSLPIVMPCRS